MDYRVILASDQQLREKAFEIRREVFVVEQQVSVPEEFDEFEDESHHFVALDDEERPIGAARWRRTDKGIKLERFAVKKNLRGKGLGSAIVQGTLQHINANSDPGTYLYMHSQLDAVPLYEKFGFQKEGEQFEECKMMHYLMWRRV